jgi:ABC-type glutathione transport system ATPase component
MNPVLIQVKDLTVTLEHQAGATDIVQDMSFQIRTGETLGMVGESGSGKSVTAKALLGLLPAKMESTGSILVGGRELQGLAEKKFERVRGSEIGFISQDPMTSLDPAFQIGTQLDEVVRQHRGLSRRRARQVVLELLQSVHLRDPQQLVRRYPHELSGGMAQRVCIARALAGEPRLLIADEPTTALDVTVQSEILDLLHELQKSREMAILLITHDWGVVADICDHVIVMYAGKLVESGPVESVMRAPADPYTAALLASDPHNAPVGEPLPTLRGAVSRPVSGEFPATARRAPMGHDTLLDVRDLTVEYGNGRSKFRAVDNVCLTINSGETVGLVGESGSGKSTIGRVVLGLVSAADGAIDFSGTSLLDISPKDRRRLARDLQVVFQDPYSSLNPARTVEQTLTEVMRGSGEKPKSIAARMHWLLERVGLGSEAAWKYPSAFSGGQCQRIAIARALMMNPRLIVCDEVVSALDLSVQAEVLNLLGELQRELGVSYLFISHDLAVVRHIAQRMVILYRGQVVEAGVTAELFKNPQHPYTQKLLAAALQPDPLLARQSVETASSRAGDPSAPGRIPTPHESKKKL